MNRSLFLRQAALGAGSIALLPQTIFSRTPGIADEQLPAEKVKEFVSAGHNNLDKVKTLLEEFPTLIYASWDLGKGDFETAIEGAGHVGSKDIAEYLIAAGARVNLFVLSMLGKTAIVKPYLEAFPQYLYARGPHGYTLLHHAKRGKEDAEELVEYFMQKGLKETRMAL